MRWGHFLPKQYGFRAGPSTIDMIEEAVQAVGLTKVHSRHCRWVVPHVTLDIINVFNSARLCDVLKALGDCFHVPGYLLWIVTDYIRTAVDQGGTARTFELYIRYSATTRASSNDSNVAGVTPITLNAQGQRTIYLRKKKEIIKPVILKSKLATSPHNNKETGGLNGPPISSETWLKKNGWGWVFPKETVFRRRKPSSEGARNVIVYLWGRGG